MRHRNDSGADRGRMKRPAGDERRDQGSVEHDRNAVIEKRLAFDDRRQLARDREAPKDRDHRDRVRRRQDRPE